MTLLVLGLLAYAVALWFLLSLVGATRRAERRMHARRNEQPPLPLRPEPDGPEIADEAHWSRRQQGDAVARRSV